MDVLEKNIQNMADHCRNVGIILRGHTKSHKSSEIAKMQVATGSKGIVCQNIVGRHKVRRLTELARLCQMTVTVDSLAVASGISEQASLDGVTIGVLIELDSGGGRTGVQSPAAAEELAQ